jgi:serine/threonine-protein kinase
VGADAVFRAAQLDSGMFGEVAPVTVPPVPTDRLQAWEGPHPAIPGMRLHIETGWWQGRVTYVKFRWPWTKDTGPARYNAWISEIQEVLLPVLTGIVLTFAILFARRNWRQGRGDRRGAFVVGMAMFTLNLLNWAASVHAVPSTAMTGMLFEALAGSTFRGALFLLMYLALEPALRARWPHSIITWNRALAGRWKDAQLASDILIGTTVGALILVAVSIHDASLASRYGLGTLGGLYLLNGSRYWITGMIARFSEGVTTGITIFFAIFGLRTVLRRDWIAAIAGALIFATLEGDLANAINWQVEFAVYAVLFGVLIFVMLRLGLVVTVVSIFAINLINGVTLGTDLTAWYAPTGFATMIVAIAIALWAFRQTLGERELV